MLNDERIEHLIDPLRYFDLYAEPGLSQRITPRLRQLIHSFHYGPDPYAAPPAYVSVKMPRGTGKTFAICLYAIWYATFHPGCTVGVAAPMRNALDSVFSYIHHVQVLIRINPFQSFSHDKRYGTTFNNGSVIMGVVNNHQTALHEARGYMLNLLLCDDTLPELPLPIMRSSGRIVAAYTPRI